MVMAKPIVSKKRANALSYAILLFMLALISFRGSWWPDICIAIGTSLAFRNFLRHQYKDMVANIIIFGGLYAYVAFGLSWAIVLPVMLILGAIYVLFKEFLIAEEETEVEHEEEINQEIEEDIE
jgi:phosphotransferase system  glucose/maltose/N-acetylglucosamine-specific IIC component